MKVNLHKNFTTKNNLYAKYHPHTIHLLYKYIKKAAPKMPSSEGSFFAQGDVNKGNAGKGGCNKRGGHDKDYDEKYCKDKECLK